MPPRRNASVIRQTADLGVGPAPAAPALRITAGVPALVYLRVSSKEQEKEGFSIPAQQRLLHEYAEAKGYRIEREFTDIETAKKAGRSGFDEMMRYLKKHKSTRVVIVEKTDRLYRNIRDWVTLDGMNLEIHLVKENAIICEESRSHEKFIHGIKVIMAKNYIDNLSEETRKGMAEKAEQGIWPGAAPFGYLNTVRADGKRIIGVDPEVAPLISRMFKVYAEGGTSMLALSKVVESWGLVGPKTHKRLSVPTIHYTLTNLIYTGEFAWNGRVYKGIHTPLVSRELWDRVQQLLEGRAKTSSRERTREFLFTGLVKCGVCADEGHENRLLIGELQKGKYVYYHCDGCRLKKRATWIREADLDGEIRRALRRLSVDAETLSFVREALHSSHRDQRKHHTEALERLNRQYTAIQTRIETAYDDRLDGRITADLFERKSCEWRTEQARIRRDIERHERADRAYIEEGLALLELSARALTLYDQQSTEERRRLLKFVLWNCRWRADNFEVGWRKPFDRFAECASPPDESDPGIDQEEARFKRKLHETQRSRTTWRADQGLRVFIIVAMRTCSKPEQNVGVESMAATRPRTSVLVRAREWEALIGRLPGVHNRADLAAHLGVSRARVTQALAPLAVGARLLAAMEEAEARGALITNKLWRELSALNEREALAALEGLRAA